MFLFLFLLFTIVPAIELYLLIAVGSRIGALPTISIVIVMGIWGAALARKQGFQVVREIQNQLSAGKLPTTELIHGTLVFMGGLLLITPGFLSDIIGILLLIPVTRSIFIAAVNRYFKQRIQTIQIISTNYESHPKTEPPKVIKVDYREL